MSIVTCRQCGQEAPPDARQCPKCGTTLGSRPRTHASSRFKQGDVIDGRYEVVERLPGGGMGELYRVRHIHLGDFRVIKLLRSDQLSDETQRRRFFQEAKIAASIKNQNVGLLHDFAALSDGTYYMVEEFIDGLTISRSLRTGRRFTLGEIVDIARQVLAGLVAIHEKGIIHRDISPDNIMLCEHEGALQARIIDLGIAKHAIAPEGQALTSAGLFVGKPHYASPEQLRMMESEETIDHRTDLYSLGVVIYEMIVGKVPFEAATPLAYLLKQISEEVSTVNRDVSGVVPGELDKFIVRLLKTKRGERFASSREALRALDEVIASIPQLLYRNEFGAPNADDSFPRVAPPRRKESTDEIPVAQLVEMVEYDRTHPGEANSRAVDFDFRDDDGMPTEVQSIEGLSALTHSQENPASQIGPNAPTLSTTEVPNRPPSPDRTVPASVPLPPRAPAPTAMPAPAAAHVPPSVPVTAPAASGVEASPLEMQPPPRKGSNRGLVIALIATAFAIVVAIGGWLFFLLLQSKFGAKEQAGTTTATTTATTTVSTTVSTTVATATQPPPPDPATASTQEIAPPASAVETVPPPTSLPTTKPAKPTVSEKPVRPPRATKPPVPTATAAPATVVATAPPQPQPVEPALPVVREGDTVAPGEGVIDAQLLKKVEPLATPSSAVMGNRGFAMFSVLVGVNGEVEQARVIRSSGSAAFDDLATAAAKKSTYTPATKEGVRVKMWRTLRYDVKVRGTM